MMRGIVNREILKWTRDYLFLALNESTLCALSFSFLAPLRETAFLAKTQS
jgi:hypothetical protein